MSDPSDEQAPPLHPGGGETSRRTSRRAVKHLIEGSEGVPALLYRDESGAQRVYRLEANRAVTIGRGEGADVHLWWDPSVSLVHAQAVSIGGHWLISDDGVSRNGTYINGERLNGRRRLRNGDVVRVGRTALAFDDASTERSGATTLTDVPSATGTVTLLFTDFVGSTELMDRLGDDAGDRLRREHFAILREAAGEHGGQEVKSLGDGLMLAFPSALGGVACAVTMQRRTAGFKDEAGGEAMGLRIGLNAGEVISAEDDYFGTPVVVAKRLCDRAGAGQALLSDVVRSLVGSRGEYRFASLGALQLKGFTDPVMTFELIWRSESASGAHADASAAPTLRQRDRARSE
jgi:class 3 adenylate cyclase